MNRLNITSILTRIATERDQEMQLLAEQLSDGKKTSGNPIAIRFKPAVRDFIILLSGRMGISSAEIVNIMIEGIMRETLIPHQAQITSIHERFWLLMDEHKLSPIDTAQLLSQWNIGLSVLENRERTLDYLRGPLLRQLSEWFCVSDKWLEGDNVKPFNLTVFDSWLRVTELLKSKINESRQNSHLTQPELFLVKERRTKSSENININTNVFIFIKRNREINNTFFSVVECVGYCDASDDSQKHLNEFLNMCGLLFKNNVISMVATLLTSEYLIHTIKNGEALAASVLWQIKKNQPDTQRIWNLEERFSLLNPENSLNPEWMKITEGIIKNARP